MAEVEHLDSKNNGIDTPKQTVILGISAYYHDSAAAIVANGEVLAAAQQERYSRIKHDPKFPIDAINFCLKKAKLDLCALDAVVFYDKPLLKFERLLETYLVNAPRGYRSFVRAMPIWLKEKLYLKKVLKDELANLVYTNYAKENEVSVSEAKKRLKKGLVLPQLLFTEHHQSHAAAAYFPSPFLDAAVVCLDGVGEWTTSSIWQGKNGDLSPLQEIQFPHSLGLLYSAFTQYCGFKVNSGEYKLMGLAPYGQPTFVNTIYQHLISVRNDGSFTLNMDYFDFATGSTMTNQAFHDLFGGAPHDFDETMQQKQMDLARSIQVVTEEIVLKIIATAYSITHSRNLCLAGGVALNCVSNGRIAHESSFENVWIQPAAGDAGSALGAAFQVWHQYFNNPKKTTDSSKATNKIETSDQVDSHLKQKNNAVSDKMQGAYLGDEFKQDEIIAICKKQGLRFHEYEYLPLLSKTAVSLTENKVVGWFQGKMEFGPRALGNRSILGDPRSKTMQTQMNLKIKQRESFRPFAPAVLEEDAQEWFNLRSTSPYMLQTAPVRECKRVAVSEKLGLDKLKQNRSAVPAITHVDYSARVQTVSKATNPKFHDLIQEFKTLTEVGMVINTSFNVRGEPPVRSPHEAIRCFLATDMDVLVMENCVLYKEEQAEQAIQEAKKITFEKD